VGEAGDEAEVEDREGGGDGRHDAGIDDRHEVGRGTKVCEWEVEHCVKVEEGPQGSDNANANDNDGETDDDDNDAEAGDNDAEAGDNVDAGVHVEGVVVSAASSGCSSKYLFFQNLYLFFFIFFSSKSSASHAVLNHVFFRLSFSLHNSSYRKLHFSALVRTLCV